MISIHNEIISLSQKEIKEINGGIIFQPLTDLVNELWLWWNSCTPCED